MKRRKKRSLMLMVGGVVVLLLLVVGGLVWWYKEATTYYYDEESALPCTGNYGCAISGLSCARPSNDSVAKCISFDAQLTKTDKMCWQFWSGISWVSICPP